MRRSKTDVSADLESQMVALREQKEPRNTSAKFAAHFSSYDMYPTAYERLRVSGLFSCFVFFFASLFVLDFLLSANILGSLRRSRLAGALSRSQLFCFCLNFFRI